MTFDFDRAMERARNWTMYEAPPQTDYNWGMYLPDGEVWLIADCKEASGDPNDIWHWKQFDMSALLHDDCALRPHTATSESVMMYQELCRREVPPELWPINDHLAMKFYLYMHHIEIVRFEGPRHIDNEYVMQAIVDWTNAGPFMEFRE